MAGLDKIIHIDCSLWESMRALQKVIAKELGLSDLVMASFNQCDAEDDFNGVEQGARGVLPHVKDAILKELRDSRLLVIFHNGSGSYIDLQECGVPVIGLLSKRVLWTSRGRFRLHGSQDDVKNLAGSSSIAISAEVTADCSIASIKNLLLAEAEEVARYTGVPEPNMNAKIVIECLFYKALIGNDYSIDWGTHAPNYWVCDGIIQDGTDGDRSAWEISNALHRNINMHMDWHQIWMVNIHDVIGLCGEPLKCCDRWVSANQQYLQELPQREDDIYSDIAAVHVPLQATSFFWTTVKPSINDNSNINTSTKLQVCKFGQLERSRLRVIHLSQCIFSFLSPPFLGCSNLRFLLLDHCKDKDTANHGGNEENNPHSHTNSNHDGACFQKLWVLDLNYTDWCWLVSEEMMDLMADLRELNVKGVKNWSTSHLQRASSARGKSKRLLNLCKLRVTAVANDIGRDEEQASPVVTLDLPCLRILTTVILDGCFELELISFRRCTQLKNLLLRGTFVNLKELDISGTAVKILDLRAAEAHQLRRLFLLGCEKLRAILWPQEGKDVVIGKLHIDTTQTALPWEEKWNEQGRNSTSVGSSSKTVHRGGQTPSDSDFYILLRDARLLRSLVHIRTYHRFYVEISSVDSAVAPCVQKGAGCEGIKSSFRDGVSTQILLGNLYVEDTISIFEDNPQASNENRYVTDASAIKWMWPRPPTDTDSEGLARCYIWTKDDKWMKLPQGTNSRRGDPSATTLPGFVPDKADILYLHDSLTLTCLPGPEPAKFDHLIWKYLLHCRIERCPNLEASVFLAPSESEDGNNIFWWLKTLWVSQLLKARYIWDCSTSRFRPSQYSFEDLVFLHLDYCPRLVHVLPLYPSNGNACRNLETLEIVCCGDLKEVFPSGPESQQHEDCRKFGKLKRIHLCELAMLQRICGCKMSAPELETVKIRGCWSLKRLPAVLPAQPTVDCEKEWWDGLEWDGAEAGHDPSHYKPNHSRFYKKALLRVSMLR